MRKYFVRMATAFFGCAILAIAANSSRTVRIESARERAPTRVLQYAARAAVVSRASHD